MYVERIRLRIYWLPILAVMGVFVGGDPVLGQDKFEILPSVPHHNHVNAVIISPNSKLLLSVGKDGNLKLWDAASIRLIRNFWGHSRDVTHATFSPDGQRILVGTKTLLKLWDAASGRLIRTFSGHTDKITAVAFSPDGSQLLSGSADQTVKLWRVDSKSAVRSFRHTAGVRWVAFLQNGKRIVSASFAEGFSLEADSRNEVKVWDPKSSRALKILPGRHPPIAVSGDGIKALSNVRHTHDLYLWDLTTDHIIRSFSNITADSAILSAEGGLALSGGTLWDLTTKEVRQRLAEFPDHDHLWGHLSPDGKRIVAGTPDRSWKMWETVTGQLINTFELWGSDPLRSVAFSPHKKVLLDSRGNIWDAVTGHVLRHLKLANKKFNGAKFSPDGKLIVTGDDKGYLTIWQADTGDQLLTFEAHPGYQVQSIALSFDGRFLLSSSGSGARVYYRHRWRRPRAPPR